MPILRVGRPTFLGDTALSVTFGAVATLPLALLLAAMGNPEWGQTLRSFFVAFSFVYLSGLLMRLGLHATYSFMHTGTDPATQPGRESLLRYTRPLLRFGAGSAGAAAVLSVLGS